MGGRTERVKGARVPQSAFGSCSGPKFFGLRRPKGRRAAAVASTAVLISRMTVIRAMPPEKLIATSLNEVTSVGSELRIPAWMVI